MFRNKLRNSLLPLALLLMASILSCQQAIGGQQALSGSSYPRLLAAEGEPIELADNPESSPRWTEYNHRSLSWYAASYWGLSSTRANNISEASDDPDSYQSGLDNGWNQQWSHAYIWDCTFGSTYYLWGDAEEDFSQNLNGPLGGEGRDGKYAGYYYAAGNQYAGDRYLGYALHYIEDLSLVLHTTAPTSMGITVDYKTTDMITHHFDFESWVQNNMFSGHRLMDAVAADAYYYAVSDPAQSAVNASWASTAYRGTSSVGYSAWVAYRNAGYPTASGSGSATLAANVKKMLVSAARYARGTVKYALDRYGQWTARY